MTHACGIALLADLDNDGNFEAIRVMHDTYQNINGTTIDNWVKREFFEKYDWVHVSDVWIELSERGLRIRAEIETDSNPDHFNVIVCSVSSNIDY